MRLQTVLWVAVFLGNLQVISFAWTLPRIGTPAVSVTCQTSLSVFSLMYMYKTIDPITLTS